MNKKFNYPREEKNATKPNGFLSCVACYISKQTLNADISYELSIQSGSVTTSLAC